MAVCGSCGMRMDGGAVLACKTAMRPLVEAGRVPVISPMGNLPVIKDLVVDMEPFWAKIRAVKPYLRAGSDVPEREHLVDARAQQANVGKEALCIMCGCCVSECNSMEADPDFLGPAALAKAQRFVGDVRDDATRERLKDLSAPTASGTAPAATSATSAARRASTRGTRSRSSAPKGSGTG